MVTKHLGLGIAEEQRARWAQLIGLAADDAGLPADPEFRSAFMAYVRWAPGSRSPTRSPVRSRPNRLRFRGGAGGKRRPTLHPPPGSESVVRGQARHRAGPQMEGISNG